MRMVPVYECYTNGDIQGLTAEMVPEDDVIASAIFGATSYLLRMEELVLIEKDEKELKSLQEDIPDQKGYILELWGRMEDPSRVQARALERDPNVEEVRQRLLEELKSKGSFGF